MTTRRTSARWVGEGIWPAGSHDEQCGLPGVGCQIGGAGVAGRHGGVHLRQHYRQRLADDITAADNHGILPSRRVAAALEQLHDAGGRAGAQPRFAAQQLSEVLGVEAVDVARWSDARQRRFEAIRQRQLDDDSMLAGI